MFIFCGRAASLLFTLGVPKISPHQKIQVWDNVVDAPTCQRLQEIQSGLSHKLFKRSKKEGKSELESVLDSVLKELNDTSPYVEYWCRQEWRHIEAHADVDEFRAKTFSKESFRYPRNGHVLYLEVGPKVHGPTCLFPDCSSGGCLLSSANGVVTVPAVQGRLLRFDGTLLHAVPRPPDLWLLPFVQGTMDYESPEYTRSVVLFNTWDDEPPLQIEEEEEESCSLHPNFVSVKPRNKWTEKQLLYDSTTTDLLNKKAKIWLLGDEARRNHTLRTIPIFSNENEIRNALYERNQPRWTRLSPSS